MPTNGADTWGTQIETEIYSLTSARRKEGIAK
jgi:hypothetical protein